MVRVTLTEEYAALSGQGVEEYPGASGWAFVDGRLHIYFKDEDDEEIRAAIVGNYVVKVERV